MILAVKISPGEHEGPNILADYLNAIYFGRGAYGIEAASQAYFGKKRLGAQPRPRGAPAGWG